MEAGEIMTRHPVSIGPDTDITDAARIMLDTQVGELPVVDQAGRLLGMVTAPSLMRRAAGRLAEHRPGWFEVFFSAGRLAQRYAHLHGRHVTEVMQKDPHAVSPDTTLNELVALMHEHRAERLPVVREDILVGVVSRADTFRTLARRFARRDGGSRYDADIRDRIAKELAQQPWMEKLELAITVRDGVVELDGRLFDDGVREGVRAVAENVPGVRAVHDHLVWIGPVFGGGPVISPEDQQASHG